jgi:hypothetical protein
MAQVTKRSLLSHNTCACGEYNATISIDDGNLMAGNFPAAKLKLVQAWIEIHKDELIADWKLAVTGQPVFKIEALK